MCRKGRPPINRTGLSYGRLVVIAPASMVGYWVCRCQCGEEAVVRGGNLSTGNTQSCGCLRREISQRKGVRLGKNNAGRIYCAEHRKRVSIGLAGHKQTDVHKERKLAGIKRYLERRSVNDISRFLEMEVGHVHG
jgi:hypothetical protein